LHCAVRIITCIDGSWPVKSLCVRKKTFMKGPHLESLGSDQMGLNYHQWRSRNCIRGIQDYIKLAINDSKHWSLVKFQNIYQHCYSKYMYNLSRDINKSVEGPLWPRRINSQVLYQILLSRSKSVLPSKPMQALRKLSSALRCLLRLLTTSVPGLTSGALSM